MGTKSFCEPIEIQTSESCELFISSLQPGNLSLNFYNTTHLSPAHKVLYCSINGASVGELLNTFLQFSNCQRHYEGEYKGIDLNLPPMAELETKILIFCFSKSFFFHTGGGEQLGKPLSNFLYGFL